MRVILIGPPGAGKSEAGRLLARQLGVPFLDTDQVVAAQAGKPVQDIFLDDGEPAFRELERAAAIRALDLPDAVIALGSGAVLDARIRERLTAVGGTVVYLDAGFPAVARHAGLDRPRVVLPGNPRGRLRALLEERRPRYEELATITVPAGDADPEELAARVAALIAGPR